MEEQLALAENIFFTDSTQILKLSMEDKQHVYSYKMVENENGWELVLSKTDRGHLYGYYPSHILNFTSSVSYLKCKHNSASIVTEESTIVEVQELSFRQRLEERRSGTKRSSIQSYTKPASKKSKPAKRPSQSKKPNPVDPIVDKIIVADDHKDTYVISSSEEEDNAVNKVEMTDSEPEPELIDTMDIDNDNQEIVDSPKKLYITDMFGVSTNTPVLPTMKNRKKVDKMVTIDGVMHVKEEWVTDDEQETKAPVQQKLNVHRINNDKKPDNTKKQQQTLSSFFSKK